MKYSEFEIIAEENGWEIDMDEDSKGWIIVSKGGFEIVISQVDQSRFNLYARKEGVIHLHREKGFIEACYELAETPIGDRKDEKYYIVELPFLNVIDEKLSLVLINDPCWSANFSHRFTEKEIKEIDPRLWDFAVEVEEDDI